MKRLADEESTETESTAKKIRRHHSATSGSGSAVTEERLLSESNSLRPKDGIIEEVHVTNFMTFNSHRFRLALSCTNFDIVSYLNM